MNLLEKQLEGRVYLLLWEVKCLTTGSSNNWRRQWQPTSVLLPGKSHRQKSLAGYSPWGHKESDLTGRLHPTSSNNVSFVIVCLLQICSNFYTGFSWITFNLKPSYIFYLAPFSELGDYLLYSTLFSPSSFPLRQLPSWPFTFASHTSPEIWLAVPYMLFSEMSLIMPHLRDQVAGHNTKK